ncbi:MAG: GtrA family protein [Eubacteriales bacterium]
MNKTKELLRALKFTVISISAGIVQILSFTLLNEVIKLPDPEISHLIALVLSVIWNFTINRKVTFKSSNNLALSMALVGLFYLVFTPTSTLFMKWATDAGLNEYLVEAINMIANFVLEFLFTRFVVYRNSCDTAEKK